MSVKEVDRLSVVRKVSARRLRQREAAETLRQWMMAEGLWKAKARRRLRIHQRRPRRACFGEYQFLTCGQAAYAVIQMDGSPHAWFEDRGGRCTLIVFIDGMEPGNAFLPVFMADYNRRFAVAAKSPEDAHRAVLHDAQERDLILRLHATRKLSKNLTFQYLNREYQITGRGQGYRLRGAAVTVCDAFGAGVKVLHQGKALDFRILAEGEPPVALDDEKSV